MKETFSKEKKESRRKFLNTGLTAGAAIAVGAVAGNLIKEQRQETVKMITADGRLVEVETKHLNRENSKVVSNQELKEWMERNKG